jgi:hypothetical protein
MEPSPSREAANCAAIQGICNNNIFLNIADKRNQHSHQHPRTTRNTCAYTICPRISVTQTGQLHTLAEWEQCSETRLLHLSQALRIVHSLITRTLRQNISFENYVMVLHLQTFCIDTPVEILACHSRICLSYRNF